MINDPPWLLLRHHLSYINCWSELRSVDQTAAPNAKLQLRSVDASSASLQIAELAAVWITAEVLAQSKTTPMCLTSARNAFFVASTLLLDCWTEHEAFTDPFPRTRLAQRATFQRFVLEMADGYNWQTEKRVVTNNGQHSITNE